MEPDRRDMKAVDQTILEYIPDEIDGRKATLLSSWMRRLRSKSHTREYEDES